MTQVKNAKEVKIGKEIYFVEQYKESAASVWLWRYGYLTKDMDGNQYGVVLRSVLRSRPNLNKIFG